MSETSREIAISTQPEEQGSGDARERVSSPAQVRQRQLAAVRTGLYVKAENGRQLRDRRVRRLARKVRTAMPWLADSDMPALRAWCELEILGSTCFAELLANGVTNDTGEPRRLLGDYRGLRTVQLAYERELGLTPAARAALGVKGRFESPADYARRLPGKAS